MIEGTCFHQRKRSTETAIPRQQWKPRKSFSNSSSSSPLSLQLVGHKEKGSRRSKGILEALSHIYFRFFSSWSIQIAFAFPCFFFPSFFFLEYVETKNIENGMNTRKRNCWLDWDPPSQTNMTCSSPPFLAHIKLAWINFSPGCVSSWTCFFLPFTINDETFFFFFTEAKVVWVNLISFCQLWQIALAFRWRVQRRIFILFFFSKLP